MYYTIYTTGFPWYIWYKHWPFHKPKTTNINKISKRTNKNNETCHPCYRTDHTTASAATVSGVCCQDSFCTRPALSNASAAMRGLTLHLGTDLIFVILRVCIASINIATATDWPATSRTSPLDMRLKDWATMCMWAQICSGFASQNSFCRWVKTVPTSHRLINTFVQHTPGLTKCGRPYDLQMSEFFFISDFGIGPISAMKAAKSVWLCTSYRAKSTSVALFKYANVCGPSHVSNDWPPLDTPRRCKTCIIKYPKLRLLYPRCIWMAPSLFARINVPSALTKSLCMASQNGKTCKIIGHTHGFTWFTFGMEK